MRRIFIFLIFYFLFSEAHAQIGDYRTDFAVGGSVGYMLSNVGFMPEVPQGMLGGLTGGLTFRYTSEKYFKSICALVAEVNLAQTGWKEDIKDVNPQKLQMDVCGINKKYKLGYDNPKVDEFAQWIEAAKD